MMALLGEWENRAACRGHDQGVTWYSHAPIGSSQRGFEDAQAVMVCAMCPVRRECLEHALNHVEKAGVWGGKTSKERRVLLKQRNRQMTRGQLGWG